jgi:glycosyltransferase involved in cell wall biosynthesis
MTAPGWVIGDRESSQLDREEIRERLGIDKRQIVFGIVGALEWNTAKRYCYGLELVEALKLVKREDVTVLIVGGGTGYCELNERLEGLNSGRVIMTGPVELRDVMKYLAAFDVASLPQSMDRVGMFRYTTKISEYLMSRLPVVTSRFPAAYDLDDDWMWRLPGKGPWEKNYIEALATLMKNITLDEILAKQKTIPADRGIFDPSIQVARVGKFIRDVLEEHYKH